MSNKAIEFIDMGCAEQCVMYRGHKFYWVPGQGNFRVSGQSKPYISLATKRDVVLHVVSKYAH